MGRLSLMLMMALFGTAYADLYEPMRPPFTMWIDQGKPVAQIVTDAFGTDAPRPDQWLNEYLEKITGAALPLSQKPSTDRPNVYLGPKRAAAQGVQPTDQLGAEGFAIISRGPDLFIFGNDRLATLYGVSAFLEECLGIRWFWHDETGEYIPRTGTLYVGQINRSHTPSFRYRWVGGGQWALFNRLNVATGQPEEFRTKWFVHTFLRLVPPEKYWETHPEYYAERGGVRQDPREREKRVQLCTSNPEVAKAVAQTIDEIMKADPDIDMISVDPEDSQNFCQCAQCKALDEPGAPYPRWTSRRLALFYKQVADLVAPKYPDLLLKSIAYHTYVAPPADPDITLPDNCVIQFCRFEGHDHPLFDTTNPKNRQFHDFYHGWRRIAKHIIFYEYYYKASWLHLPWPITHTLREEIPYLRDQGLMGIATQHSANFGTHGLGYYVAAKLLWNADLDVDELLADYYEKAFGGAAGPMRQYYERLERAVLDSGVNLAGQRPYATIIALFTPPVVADLSEALKRAQQSVEDEGAKARVDLVARGLRYTQMLVEYLHTIDGVRAKGVSTRWFGGVTPQMKQEVVRLAGPQAKAIRAFLQAPDNRPAVGGLNSYTELALKPEQVLGAWRDGSTSRGLTKAEWLKTNPGIRTKTPTGNLALWVYGYDLDFVGGKPEHTILLRDAEGNEKVLGHVGTPESPGDAHARCYVLPGLRAEDAVDGKLLLTVTNESGGPYASRFSAFYLMPPMKGLTSDYVTSQIHEDIEWVRAMSCGFTELEFDGLRSNDGDRHPITIELGGQKADD